MLLVIFVLGIVYQHGQISPQKYIRLSAQSKIAFFCITLVCVCVSGFRYQVGADFSSYYNNYSYYVSDAIDIRNNNEIGIRIIAKIASRFGSSPQIYIFLCSAVTVILFMIAIKKYTDFALLSFMLYIFLGMFIGSFNAVRQYLACSIIFLGIGVILDGKAIKWILCVIGAFLCHTSAVFILPLYWLVRIKNRKRFIVITLVIAVIAYFSYDNIFSLIDSIKGNVDRSVADRLYAQNSVNIFRVLVSWVPVLLCYFPVKIINTEDERDRILMNFAVVAAALQTVSMNSTYLARFCTYTTASNILVIPALMKYQTANNRKVLTILILLFYFIYWTSEAAGAYVVHYQWCF